MATVGEAFRFGNRVYTILKLVGSGSHKNVYAGEPREGGPVVAIVSAKRGVAEMGSPLGKEVRALRLCKGIEGVVQVIASPVFAADGWTQMVTELCEEGDFIRWSKGKSLRERFAVLLDVAKALKSLHEASLGHRDVKSANIGVKKGESGHLHGMLMDCELLISEEQSAKEQGQLIGSPAYLPPYGDQVDYENVEHSTPSQHDVYALGATLFEACRPQVVPGDLCQSVIAAFERSSDPLVYLFNTKMSEIQEVIARRQIIDPIRELMISMLETNPKKRCSINDVVEKIEAILQLSLPELDKPPGADSDGTGNFSPSASSPRASPNPAGSPVVKTPHTKTPPPPSSKGMDHNWVLPRTISYR